MTQHVLKRRWLPVALGAGLLAAAPAVAQQSNTDDAIPDPFKGAVHEGAVKLADCQKLLGRAPVEHTADASVTYQPGEDVRGNPVTPAEGPQADAPLGAIKIEVPKRIVIDFGYDFAGAYGIPDTGLEQALANVAKIEYDLAMGALTVNGKALNKTDSRAVREACKRMIEAQGDNGGD